MESHFDNAVARLVLNPLWTEALWSATTFRWHPTSEAPPVMGLCFENSAPAQELFAQWVESRENTDALEELRISIIEGDIPERRPGYSVHLCVDPEGVLAQATLNGVVAYPDGMVLPSRFNRMHPVPGSPPLLANFKREFQRHREFLLAPVTRRWDGQLWFDLELGIVKTKISFRNVADVHPGDIDAVVCSQLDRESPPPLS